MKKTLKKDSFAALLRKSGYRATPSRLIVLTLLAENKHPMSAQSIIQAVGKRMDQATVYRIFNDLSVKGLIRQIDLRHNHAHYELTNTEEHHHLVCMQCGRIEDVHQCGVEEVQANVLKTSKHFSEIKQHALEFYGICKACAKKQGTVEIRTHEHASL